MKVLYRSPIAFLFLFFIIHFTTAQERFERMYRAGGIEILTSALHEYGDGYLVLGLEFDQDGETPYINLSKLDNKGTIDWSMSYDYSDKDIFISELGEVEVLADNSIAFSAYLQKDSLNKLVTNVDGSGNVRWTILTGRENDVFSGNGNRSNLINLNNPGILHVTTERTENRNDVFLSQISLSGELTWGQSLTAMDTLNNVLSTQIRDGIYLSDSSILMVGNTMSEDHQIFLLKMDTLGNILWSKSYNADLGTGLNQSSMSLTEMLDGSIVVLGAQAGASSVGLLLQVDANGNYIKSRSVRSTDSNYDFIPVGVVTLIDSTVAVSVKRLDLISGQVNPIIFKYDMDSTLYYQSMLKSSTDINPTRSGFISPDSVSAVFLTSSILVDSLTLYPYLSKLDGAGQTDCIDLANILSFDSIFFATDTLVWTSTETTTVDSITVTANAFNSFDPPVLTLQDTSFCPQDPIFFKVDATVRGAVSYLWDDGSMDSIRVFTEEGMYSVIVKVGIETCFTLCDTTNITKKEFPMAQIAQDNMNFCSAGEIALGVSANNPITEILWSTGQSSPVIVVTPLTRYDVAIIDDCGNPAEASLNLTDFRIRNNPSISVSGANLCTDNSLLLTANGDFNVSELMWSNGEVGVPSISITAPGTYSVENLAQFCPGMGSVTIIADQFLSPLTVDIQSTCITDAFRLSAFATGATSIQWENGTTTAVRNVTQAGTYAVIATDICGNTETATIIISQQDVDDCIELPDPPVGVDCAQWPNALFPASNNMDNRTFGPEEMNCGNFNLTAYELRIYNRWGQMMFKSTDAATRWNGKKDNTGNDLPADTYFWYAKYTINNDNFEQEGDVTIIR